MKILVCISHVPDTTTKIRFENNQLVKDGVNFIIGPYDDYALARAIEIKNDTNCHVTVLNVGPADTEPTIRKALAIGADDAIRIDAEPKDALFVARQIYEVVKKDNYDMVLMGRETSDFNGGLVHGMVAEMLGWPSVAPCMKLELNEQSAKLSREIEGGKEDLELSLPFVAGCQEPIAEWKIPNMRGIMTARKKPLQVIPPAEEAHATKYLKFELPASRKECKMIDPDHIEELVQLLKNEAKAL